MVLSNDLMGTLSEAETRQFLSKLYGIMDRQVQSYYKSRRMGHNSSVTTDFARELMASVEYTLSQVKMDRNLDPDKVLVLGQERLKKKLEKAKQLHRLVEATGPQWQTQCRWEAVDALRRYLETYDVLHLAHLGPEELFYPLPIAVPEALQGIDVAQFYLNILWAENQIMAMFSDEQLNEFWVKLPTDTQNQCDHVLLNALGKKMTGGVGLCLTRWERRELERLSVGEFADRWEKTLADMQWGEYGLLAARQMFLRALAALEKGNIDAVFL